MNIPSTAVLRKEENGVIWYATNADYAHAVHYMTFNDRVLSGCWAGPRWVFWALSSMSPEERASYHTHDEYMGAVNTQIAKLRGVR